MSDVAEDFWATERSNYLDTPLYFHHRFILPCVERMLGPANGRALFEIGFGSGAVAQHFADLGFAVSGIELSANGVAHAKLNYPRLAGLRQGSVYDAPTNRGSYDIILSLEVVEHLYAPRRLAALAFALVKPGGVVILSTPYHGYLKNLAIAALGRWDEHANPLRDGGHIKFWSLRTLPVLLTEAGFANVAIERVGRIPPLAKSMIAMARRPE